ncbi:hypothetical protein H9Q72_003923 [Fusarium xylarioides]|uniref:Uncharacterized protein n=1 Tax=Fusarium xylarioides TaxID=221167 RepID=A0A9P7L884_9HYPO|nr:hypothetical protein H9Q72_003923 [Fusarium xylarioides]
MVNRGAQTKPYHLLDGVIRLDEDGRVFNRLLGLVTSNLARPLDSCRPEAPFSARDHIKDPLHLYPSVAVECSDASWLVETQVEKSAKAELSKLLKMWGAHQNQQGNDYSTTLLRQIEIPENATERIRELLRDPEYLAGVHHLMAPMGPGKKCMLGVIAGFITCSDMSFNRERRKTLELGVSAELLSEAATSVPGTNAHGQASVKRIQHGKISGVYSGEVVVACYYLPIRGFVPKPGPQGLLSRLNPFRHVPRAPAVEDEAVDFHEVQVVNTECLVGNMCRPLGGAPIERSGELYSSEQLSTRPEPPLEAAFYIGNPVAQNGIV